MGDIQVDYIPAEVEDKGTPGPIVVDIHIQAVAEDAEDSRRIQPAEVEDSHQGRQGRQGDRRSIAGLDLEY